jgi:hypothetical protein
MNLLGLGSYESDEETSGNEDPMQLVTKEIAVIANISEDAMPVDKYHKPEIKEVVVGSKLSHPTSATFKSFNHLHELPPSPKKSSNPKTIRKISEYIELKEISGFNLTEVCRKLRVEHSILPAILNLPRASFSYEQIFPEYPK